MSGRRGFGRTASTTRKGSRPGQESSTRPFATTGAIDAASRTVGLSNARTRIVGTRTGFRADVVVGFARAASISRATLGRFGRRISSVLTAPGWFLVVLVPVAFVLGYTVGWTELVVVAWAGLVLLAVAALYLIGGSNLVVDLSLLPSRVVVGDEATGEILVRSPGRSRVLGAVVEVPVGDGLIDLVLPGLGRKDRFTSQFRIPATRRGIIAVGPVRSVRADPLALVRRERIWTAEAELFVHPRTIAIPSLSTGLVRDLEGNPTRDLSTSDMAFHALREYQPGDERRSIHWKSTAKTGVHMVRQFEETRRSHLLIALSLATADFASEEEFEMAVSVVGSLGTRAIRDTRDVTVAVSEKTPEFATRKVFAINQLSTLTRARLLDGLCLVGQAPAALAIGDVAKVTAERVIGISVAFLVCGSTVTSAQLRAASAQFPAGVEVVAVVCDPEHVPGLRKMAGLAVITIGYLEDLKRALAGTVAV